MALWKSLLFWITFLWATAIGASAISLTAHGKMGLVPVFMLVGATALSAAGLLRPSRWSRARMPSAREWLLDALRYYRAMGFFRTFAELDDNALADRVAELRRRQTAVDFDPTDPKSDLELLALDGNRVWWNETEVPVDPGRRFYERTLPEWGRISRGAFEPRQIREEWQTPSGPARVRFVLDGTEHELAPDVEGGVGLDLEIFAQINRLIDASGIRFEIFEPFDRTAFVVALFDVEKQRLKRERGWSFLQP